MLRGAFIADTDPALAADSDALVPTQKAVKAFVSALVLDVLYPVGEIIISENATDPAARLGGTWTQVGAGRVLVGLDSGDPDFDVSGETGGAKAVSSVGAVAAPTFAGDALGTHSHGVGTIAADAHTSSNDTVLAGATSRLDGPTNHTMSGATAAVGAGTPTGTVSAPAFTGSPTSVVQPYLVVYFWKRTA